MSSRNERRSAPLKDPGRTRAANAADVSSGAATLEVTEISLHRVHYHVTVRPFMLTKLG